MTSSCCFTPHKEPEKVSSWFCWCSRCSGKCSAFFHYPDLDSSALCWTDAKWWQRIRFWMILSVPIWESLGVGLWETNTTIDVTPACSPQIWSFRPILGETIKSNLAVLRTLLTFPLFFPFFSDFLSLSWLYCLYFFLSLLATNFINTTVERSWTAKFPTFTLSRRTTWKENFSEIYSWS